MNFFRWLFCAALGMETECRDAGSTQAIAAVTQFDLTRLKQWGFDCARLEFPLTASPVR